MKKWLILLSLLLPALGAAAQDLHCTFTSTKTLKALHKEIPGEGDITFTAPDHLTMTYTVPEGEYLIIEGDEIRSSVAGKAVKVNTAHNATMRNLRNTLLNCISGNYVRAGWDNEADVKVEERDGSKTVTLTARKAAPRGYREIVVEYDGKSGLPVRMVLDEFTGILTEFRFTY